MRIKSAGRSAYEREMEENEAVGDRDRGLCVFLDTFAYKRIESTRLPMAFAVALLIPCPNVYESPSTFSNGALIELIKPTTGIHVHVRDAGKSSFGREVFFCSNILISVRSSSA